MGHVFRRDVLLGLSLGAPLVSHVIVQDFVVGDFNLVAKERTGRTEFGYVYCVVLANSGAALQSVATVTSASSDAVVVHSAPSFGPVHAV